MLVERSSDNPILKPNLRQSWEMESVLNGCPIEKDNSIYLVYRAVSLPHYHSFSNVHMSISDVGIAKSKDGINFTDRKRLIIADIPWDKYGCEDPRVTKLNNKYYIFYTALSEYPFRAEGIRVGLAISKDLKTIEEKHLVTPFNSKAMALFPEKINGKMWAVLTVNTDKPPAHLCVVSFDKEEDMWDENRWNKWYQNFTKNSLNLQRRPQDHIEVGAPPVKTKKGWLLLYSYIRNYGTPKTVFGVEAVLLDLKDPTKVIAQTNHPLLTPEEYYEKIGHVPSVIFPSGALVKKDKIYLYYGAADTTCCLAFISMPDLLSRLTSVKTPLTFLWENEKPILSPLKENSWESKAVLNPAALYLGKKVHLIYRAVSEENTSVLGYASSKNGVDIDFRNQEPVYLPREPFEQKTNGGGFGCEDPRLIQIGPRIYMFYTAYDGKMARIALTSISENDFLNRNWNWAKPVPISPPDLFDKDACMFPEKINGKYVIIHRSGEDMDLSYHDTLDFDGKTWLEEYRWISPRPGMWDSRKVGAAAPPIKTKKGWLVLYHGISDDDNYYRVGAALTDLRNPEQIIARTDEAIFEPRYEFQKVGQTPNVVFPCGTVIIGGKLFVYYGAADQVVGMASMPLQKLVSIVDACRI